ncbi:MAG: STAS domain-containing protein [Cypionkella sp.]|nr:STAS domain-containing protein [Cypionkella sp.]
MDLSAETRGDILVVHANQERIDAAVAIQFKEKMREFAQASSPRVILDMSKVAFLDSSGLGAVVAIMKLLGPERKLELSGLTATVQKVFRLTRMDSIFIIHATLPDGLLDAG